MLLPQYTATMLLPQYTATTPLHPHLVQQPHPHAGSPGISSMFDLTSSISRAMLLAGVGGVDEILLWHWSGAQRRETLMPVSMVPTVWACRGNPKLEAAEKSDSVSESVYLLALSLAKSPCTGDSPCFASNDLIALLGLGSYPSATLLPT
ncbi:hypothetical protein C8R44DRAFT_864539 [Mycena epipterygia]|nr:hypothetical protein C8R44DRAFT_864539 [Mycena epipterygia]